MHTNRRDLLLAGACAASTALLWERRGSAKGRRARSAARNHDNSPREEPGHLHRASVRSKRPAECRGIHKRRSRRNRVLGSGAAGKQSYLAKQRYRLHPEFLWSTPS